RSAREFSAKENSPVVLNCVAQNISAGGAAGAGPSAHVPGETSEGCHPGRLTSASLVQPRGEFKALGITDISLKYSLVKYKKLNGLVCTRFPDPLEVPGKCWLCTSFVAIMRLLFGRSNAFLAPL